MEAACGSWMTRKSASLETANAVHLAPLILAILIYGAGAWMQALPRHQEPSSAEKAFCKGPQAFDDPDSHAADIEAACKRVRASGRS
jgi:hypothetical protein